MLQSEAITSHSWASKPHFDEGPPHFEQVLHNQNISRAGYHIVRLVLILYSIHNNTTMLAKHITLLTPRVILVH